MAKRSNKHISRLLGLYQLKQSSVLQCELRWREDPRHTISNWKREDLVNTTGPRPGDAGGDRDSIVTLTEKGKQLCRDYKDRCVAMLEDAALEVE